MIGKILKNFTAQKPVRKSALEVKVQDGIDRLRLFAPQAYIVMHAVKELKEIAATLAPDESIPVNGGVLTGNGVRLTAPGGKLVSLRDYAQMVGAD